MKDTMTITLPYDSRLAQGLLQGDLFVFSRDSVVVIRDLLKLVDFCLDPDCARCRDAEELLELVQLALQNSRHHVN